jgi:hypothetical protein
LCGNGIVPAQKEVILSFFITLQNFLSPIRVFSNNLNALKISIGLEVEKRRERKNPNQKKVWKVFFPAVYSSTSSFHAFASPTVCIGAKINKNILNHWKIAKSV